MMADLTLAKNMFGKSLSQNCIKRIKKFFKNPCIETWDKIYSIIILKDGTTIWQAVLMIQPSFSRLGKLYDEHGNIIEHWKESPKPETVRKAIFYVTH